MRLSILVVSLGAEQGFDYSVEGVKEAERVSLRAWLERWV